jgi:acetyl-CoA acyltransferase 2
MVFAKAIGGVFIVAAKRTPFGSYGGKLMNYSATDLQEVAFKAALAAGKIKPEWVNNVIVGNIFHATKDGAYTSRHAAIRVGVPYPVPSLAINRMCGSGFQSVVTGAHEIILHECDIVLTGGTENMSLSPHIVHGCRFGVRLGQDIVMEDSLWQGLIDQQAKMPMGMTAENLAEQYDISRQQCDEFAIRSNQRWKAANDAGYFKAEMAPITLKTKKGEVVMDTDEHPKPQSTYETISKLPPVFKKDGRVNAANASGICDGAGCVILASEAAITKHDLNPLARVAGYGVAGCDPTIMGIGPVPAIRALLKAAKMKLDDIDLVEVNEAFAPQTLAVMKELNLDPEKTNVNGGAIAVGHPVGASGSRITAHLTHELLRRKAKYAIGSACIGGGQGIAVLLESLN